MKTEILQKKLTRYLNGEAMPAETRQIQNWLSSVDKENFSELEEDIQTLESEILADIQAYTAYPALFPKEKNWWQKVTDMF